MRHDCRGTGYIGSFTTLELLVAGYDVIVIDNLYNSSEEVLNRIQLICGKKPAFYNVDVTDAESLDKVFKKHPEIDSVIHFAALKVCTNSPLSPPPHIATVADTPPPPQSVGESTEKPVEYYRVNVGGTIALLGAMEKNNVKNIVFSSSATVYGDATRHEGMIPIPEHCPIGPTNPYGRTKMMIEMGMFLPREFYHPIDVP